MGFSYKYRSISRRRVLTGASAMLGVGLTGNVTFADGGGGGEKESQPSTHNTSTNAPSPKTRNNGEKIRVMFTKEKYHRISTKGLKTAIKGIESGDEYWIDGFTEKMSRNIFEMTLMDRKYTLLIFKDMLKLKTREKRKTYLEDKEFDLDLEIERLQRELRPKTLEDALFNENKEFYERVKARLKWFRAYRRLLHQWTKKPMEGMLPSG